MPKLLNALAASALLVALSAPGFAADLNSSTSQRSSTTGVNTRSGANAQLNDRDDAHSSTSLNSKSTLDRNRDRDRPQSAQMPNRDRDRDQDRDQDINGPGRSGNSPGHEMQEHGSVPGSPGASGYAPGHR